MSRVLYVQNLTKRFGQQTVLNNISLNCDEGRIYGLVGRNGSGKTVLMKCICGLIQPSKGEIYVWGRRIGKGKDFPDNIGFIIEHPGFLMYESGFDNLMNLASIRRKADANRVRESMELVGLDPNSKKHVGKYSLGMRQRLGIAQAIMEDPDLLVLDEPMNGLDNQGVEHIRFVLKELSKKGKTILLASHGKEDIDLLCDEIYLLNAGSMSKKNSHERHGV